MKYQQCVVLLLVAMMPSSSFSQTCNSLKVNIQNSFCICDYLDDSDGWRYYCFSRTNSYEVFFSLTYIVDSTIKIECGANESYYDYEILLQQLNHTKIQTFVFQSCPLPNVSYGEVIPSYEENRLQEIRIENTRDNRSFTADLFEPTSENVKKLVLKNNGITELPEMMFSNFTKLQYLSLTDNQLTTLPEKIFHHLQQLSFLEISNNILESLPENLLQSLFQLKELFLYKNKLKTLPNNVFKSLPSLAVLDLSENQLMSVPADIFLGLSQLKHIRLRGNWLRTLPKELFSYTLNLQEIDLSFNRFMEPLPETLLHGLKKLEIFKLEDCNITFFHETFFESCPNITNLELQYNKLTTLPENIFRNNILLKGLNLNFNSISVLQENLLPNQKYLVQLSFFQNNISLIPNGFFNNARSIKTLVLGQNNIQSITKDLFRNLPSLEKIDLNKNNLTCFELDLNKDIKYIDLSYNNLTEMPAISWQNHLKLENLDLQYNKLTSFSIPILYSTSKGNPFINVAHNNIKNVNVSNVLIYDTHLQKLPPGESESYVATTVSLNSNPFTCDCRLYDFFDYLKRSNAAHKKSVQFSMIQSIACHDPPIYRNKSIIHMEPSEFTCDIAENCSSPCHCYIRAQDVSIIVNCSDHKLRKLPPNIPYNTRILHFQRNLLINMTGFDNTQWNNLTHIFLNNNQIMSLDNWIIPPNLTAVSFAGNRIRHLPDVFMNFTSGKEEFRMNLSSNPWTCNCSTMNFKKWLVEHYKMVEDASKILCAERQKQNNSLVRVSILTIPDDLMCPLDDWPYRVQIITIATVCAILALSLFIVSVLYYRNKQTVIAYIYIHMHPFFICFFNEEDIDEDKPFDAFVAYGHDDCDVAHKLVDELEPHFQLCIHERNWIAGNQISWNILNSVHNSRRTILVISKQFLESMWFQVEFHTAYFQMLEDKIDRLIIIVKGELPPKETLDKELLYLLSTKTYLIWEERWFWEKLRYAMPHKKPQVLQGNVLALKDKPDREKIKAVDNQIAILSANCNKTNEKVQEVVHNGTNRALSMVNKDTSVKRY